MINTVGNKIFSNYNYYFPDLSHYQTYNVLLFILLGAGIIYLLIIMTKNTNLKKYGLLGKNINYSFSKNILQINLMKKTV